MAIPGNAVDQEDTEHSNSNISVYLNAQDARLCIEIDPSPHTQISFEEVGVSSSLPYGLDYICAANPSYHTHVQLVVGVLLPIFRFTTAMAVKISMPLPMMDDVPTPRFWPIIGKLSTVAHGDACEICLRVESRELLAQISSWARTLLPAINNGEVKRELELLSCLGFYVRLTSGEVGLLSGWIGQCWLVTVGGHLLWVQSAAIQCRKD